MATLIAWALLAVGGCSSSSSEKGTEATTAAKAAGEASRVAVPKLVGVRWERALRLVRRAGLQQRAPGFTGTTGNPGYSGTCLEVDSQAPPPGTRVSRGTTVAVVIGACKNSIIERRPGKSASG